jgi:hypothetical protein
MADLLSQAVRLDFTAVDLPVSLDVALVCSHHDEQVRAGGTP